MSYHLEDEARGALSRAVMWHLLGAGLQDGEGLEERLGIDQGVKKEALGDLGWRLSACARAQAIAEGDALPENDPELLALLDLFIAEVRSDLNHPASQSEEDLTRNRARLILLEEIRYVSGGGQGESDAASAAAQSRSLRPKGDPMNGTTVPITLTLAERHTLSDLTTRFLHERSWEAARAARYSIDIEAASDRLRRIGAVKALAEGEQQLPADIDVSALREELVAVAAETAATVDEHDSHIAEAPPGETDAIKSLWTSSAQDYAHQCVCERIVSQIDGLEDLDGTLDAWACVADGYARALGMSGLSDEDRESLTAQLLAAETLSGGRGGLQPLSVEREPGTVA